MIRSEYGDKVIKRQPKFEKISYENNLFYIFKFMTECCYFS